jgi:hypothetical protein
MNEEEFIKELARIRKMEKDLRQTYIETNTIVKAPALVKIGTDVLWLDRYVIVNGVINPSFFHVTKTFKPAKYMGKVYVRDWREMVPYTPKK